MILAADALAVCRLKGVTSLRAITDIFDVYQKGYNNPSRK